VNALLPYISEPHGKILCFDPWLGILWKLPIPFVDAFHASLLDETGLNRMDSIHKNIKDRKFGTIITDYSTSDSRTFTAEGIPMFPLRLKTALHKYYTPVFDSWIFVVWRPKTHTYTSRN